MRIALMGSPGAGTTWMTEHLSKTYGLPAVQLDEVVFDKNWKRLDAAAVLPKVAAFMAQESWVIDGYYSDILFEERMEAADRIVLLLLPRLTCLWRAVKRSKARRAAGYKNDLNAWFLKFLLFESRSKERCKVYRDIIRRYGDKVVVLKSQRQVGRFLHGLKREKL